MSSPRCQPFRFPLALLVALLLLPSMRLAAEVSPGRAELDRWLATSSATSRFGDVADELVGLVSSADGEGLPSVAIVERIKEGAAKRVAPETVVRAASAELDRLRVVGDLLGHAGTGATAWSRADEARAYTVLSLCLRAGLSPTALSELLGEVGRGGGGADGALAASEALLKLMGVTRLEEEDLVRLGRALVRGKLPVAAYGSITSVFVKARAGRLEDAETAAVVVGVLERGGGMIQISSAVEEEIRRRSRR